jgi:hypothetical protein
MDVSVLRRGRANDPETMVAAARAYVLNQPDAVLGEKGDAETRTD